MCPEDVSRVIRNVLHKLWVRHGTQLLSIQIERVDIYIGQTEFFDRPLNPVLHV